LQYHITPETYEGMDYYRFNEILQARSKDDRPVDPGKWLKSLGL
jgi:hypothetical protein